MSFNAPAPTSNTDASPAPIEPAEVINAPAPAAVITAPPPPAPQPPQLPLSSVVTVDQRQVHFHEHHYYGAEAAVPHVHQPATVASRRTQQGMVSGFVLAALVAACLALPLAGSPLLVLPLIAALLNAGVAVRVATADRRGVAE